MTVHGTAILIDVNAAGYREFRDYYLDIYGESWHEWGAPAQYARIDADRMYTYYVRDES